MSEGKPTSGASAPPDMVKNIGTWASFFHNVVEPLLGLFVAAIVVHQTTAIASLLYCAIVLFIVVLKLLLRQTSHGTHNALLAIKSPGNISKDSRDFIAGHIERQEKRLKYTVIYGTVFLLVVAAYYLGSLGWRWMSTKVPAALHVETAVRFTPSHHKEMLRNAPFMEAVIGFLEDEGKAAKQKSEIVLINTEALTHPTPPFQLTMYYEPQSYDLAGYAFLKRKSADTNSYQSVPMNYPIPEQLGMLIPACQPGDRILVVMRLSLNKATEFPPNLAERTRTRISIPEKGTR